MKKNQIKSKVQTYDIRDCEKYNGILELESVLKRQVTSHVSMVELIRKHTLSMVIEH